MKTSPEGRALIEAFEGLFLHAYQDSVKVWTIGYGHTTAAGGVKVTPDMKISEWEADQWLADDLGRVESDVANCINVPLTQSEFDCLVSFDFNTGALRRSSIDDKINRGDKTAAMKTLLLYNHAGGRVLDGLTRRRKAEKLLFEGKIKEALALAGAPSIPKPDHPETTTKGEAPKPAPEKQASAVGGGLAGATTAAAAHEAGLPIWACALIGLSIAVIGYLIVHKLTKRGN